jgi:hypothetical protein
MDGGFNITSGLFEITNNSINFGATATTNISGGILRTGGAFNGSFAGTFMPIAGVVEVIGNGPDCNIFCYNGNYFHDLLINADPGEIRYIYGNTIIQNDLTVNSGILYTQANIISVGGDLNINDNGVYNMTANTRNDR